MRCSSKSGKEEAEAGAPPSSLPGDKGGSVQEAVLRGAFPVADSGLLARSIATDKEEKAHFPNCTGKQAR